MLLYYAMKCNCVFFLHLLRPQKNQDEILLARKTGVGRKVVGWSVRARPLQAAEEVFDVGEHGTPPDVRFDQENARI